MCSMTRKLAPTLALALAFVSAGLQAQTGGLRYTVTVAEFENQSGWEGQIHLGHAWGTVMTDLLNRSGRFTVLGESSMRAAALDEQDLGASGRTAGGSKTPAVGQMSPAQLLVKGAITHVQTNTGGKGGGIGWGKVRVGGKKKTAEINATIYLVDSTTGQVVASTSVVGHSKSKSGTISYTDDDLGATFGGHKDETLPKAISEAVAQAVDWLVEQLPNVPWSGTVVMVRDEKVYINRGTREGVSQGQLFLVGQKDVIRDPDTGEVLDESLIQVAELEATQVKVKLSVCKVVSGDVRKVHKGLGVQLPRG